jgi:hypothetical protein
MAAALAGMLAASCVRVPDTRFYDRGTMRNVERVRIAPDVRYISLGAIWASTSQERMTEIRARNGSFDPLMMYGLLGAGIAASERHTAEQMDTITRQEAPVVEPIIAEAVTNRVPLEFRRRLQEAGMPWKIVDDDSAQAEINLMVVANTGCRQPGKSETPALMVSMTVTVLQNGTASAAGKSRGAGIPGGFPSGVANIVWTEHASCAGDRNSLPPYDGGAYQREKTNAQEAWMKTGEKAVQLLVNQMKSTSR